MPDNHLFKNWRSLAIHFFEQYLECTATATGLAALTVEAEDNTHFPEFPRWVPSLSRWCFHPIVYSMTARRHASVRPSKSDWNPKRIRLCRWPWMPVVSFWMSHGPTDIFWIDLRYDGHLLYSTTDSQENRVLCSCSCVLKCLWFLVMLFFWLVACVCSISNVLEFVVFLVMFILCGSSNVFVCLSSFSIVVLSSLSPCSLHVCSYLHCVPCSLPSRSLDVRGWRERHAGWGGVGQVWCVFLILWLFPAVWTFFCSHTRQKPCRDASVFASRPVCNFVTAPMSGHLTCSLGTCVEERTRRKFEGGRREREEMKWRKGKRQDTTTQKQNSKFWEVQNATSEKLDKNQEMLPFTGNEENTPSQKQKKASYNCLKRSFHVLDSYCSGDAKIWQSADCQKLGSLERVAAAMSQLSLWWFFLKPRADFSLDLMDRLAVLSQILFVLRMRFTQILRRTPAPNPPSKYFSRRYGRVLPIPLTSFNSVDQMLPTLETWCGHGVEGNQWNRGIWLPVLVWN